MAKQFNIDLNLGDNCNFRCSYCFEREHSAARVLTDDVLERFISLVKMATETGSTVNINFWGGEPLLHIKHVRRVLDEFTGNERVSFLMYTNGWYVLDNSDLLLKARETYGKRLVIQVSHDFLPGDLSHRVNPSSTPVETEERVLNAIRFLDDNDFEYSVKTTGSFEDLEDNFCEQFVNFHNFRLTLKKRDQIGYGYTPDTCATRAVNREKFEAQLLKLLKFFAANKLKNPNFRWFNNENQRLSCGAGKHSFAVDVNGNTKYCHGCFYHNEANDDTLKIANIFDDNALFLAEHNYVAENSLNLPDGKCKTCDALVCFRCNAMNCNGDVKHWADPCVDNVCEVYKIASKYIEAFRVMSKKW